MQVAKILLEESGRKPCLVPGVGAQCVNKHVRAIRIALIRELQSCGKATCASLKTGLTADDRDPGFGECCLHPRSAAARRWRVGRDSQAEDVGYSGGGLAGSQCSFCQSTNNRSDTVWAASGPFGACLIRGRAGRASRRTSALGGHQQ